MQHVAHRRSDEIAQLRQENARLRDALEGCLHFDDAFIRDGVLGAALKKWRAEAEAALAQSST